jgi:hypothetical protein
MQHGETINEYKIFVEGPEERMPHGRINHGRTIMKQISRKQNWRVGLDSSGSGKGLVVDPCKHSDKSPNSIKGSDFLD